MNIEELKSKLLTEEDIVYTPIEMIFQHKEILSEQDFLKWLDNEKDNLLNMEQAHIILSLKVLTKQNK
jgi:hypothetical protein